MMALSSAATALLDQVDVHGRVEGVVFELVDADRNVLGAIHPQLTVQVRNSSAGALKRSISGLVLPPDEYADINLAADMVRPRWVLADAPADDIPLGVFAWSASSSRLASYGTWTLGTLMDQGLFLASPIATPIALAAGDDIRDAILRVCAMAGFYEPSVDSSDATCSAPIAWLPSAQNTYAAVLSQLAAKAGFYDWYFTAAGVLTFRTLITDIASATADFEFPSGGRIIDGTITTENELLAAPNRWIAIDTAAAGGAVVGIYDLPDDDPGSRVNRGGRVIATVIEAPGAGSVAKAEEAAQSASQQAFRGFETVKFQSIADPRHETFNIISVLGVKMIELEWSLTCAPGGPMEHVGKAVI